MPSADEHDNSMPGHTERDSTQRVERSRDSERDRNHDHTRRHHRHRSRSRGRHHRKKRSRRDDDENQQYQKSRRKGERRVSPKPETNPLTIDGGNVPIEESTLKRDAWMVHPSSDSIIYSTRRPSSPPPIITHEPIDRPEGLNSKRQISDIADPTAEVSNGDAHRVSYTFGDKGSMWRMAKLKRTYEAAMEEGESVDLVAAERYGDLRLFDDAREEEMELERRELYGRGQRNTKEKPTGNLYADRLEKEAAQNAKREKLQGLKPEQLEGDVPNAPIPAVAHDETVLNRMKAALMKAQLRGDPKVPQLKKEYTAALEASRQVKPEVVVLSAMHSRELAGMKSRVGREVLVGKKGKLVENEDMTIEDMIREEKRTKGQGSARHMAERISRDSKFTVRALNPTNYRRTIV
jgi:hypothetical protein